MHWFRKADLVSGERVVTTKVANRTQGNRAVGGILTVTDRRLIFTPHVFDSHLGGQSWSTGRGDVIGVGAAARTLKGGLFTGGMRKRLRVQTRDGEEFFVVNGLGRFLGQLNEIGLPLDRTQP